jgi:hypothetical protein
MAFVNELISEEDKKRIDWSKFKAWPFTLPISPWKWTIDRERDFFFVPLGGNGPDGERPEVYALCWNGQIVRLEAKVTGSGGGKFWDTIYWSVSKVDIPDDLQPNQDEILHALKDAICAHGRLFDVEHVKSVHIEFVSRSAS